MIEYFLEPSLLAESQDIQLIAMPPMSERSIMVKGMVKSEVILFNTSINPTVNITKIKMANEYNDSFFILFSFLRPGLNNLLPEKTLA